MKFVKRSLRWWSRETGAVEEDSFERDGDVRVWTVRVVPVEQQPLLALRACIPLISYAFQNAKRLPQKWKPLL
ncbi:MAG TPA: hypothetical protein DCG12_01215 [Planctomycetaceae bacterium]|nr:hypothetical protein [Planctomycetaceae bacterium]